jgi:hypothetical protein
MRVPLVMALAVAACGRVGFDRVALDRDGAPGSDAGDAPPGDAPRGGSATIAFVQGSGGSAAPGPASTIALPAPVAAEDLVVVTLDTYADDSPLLVSVTDTLGSTYASVGPYDGDDVREYIAYAIAPSAGTVAATVTLDKAEPMFLDLRIHEYAGIATTSPLDVAAGATAQTKGSDAASVGLVTTEANELLFALVVATNNATPGSGFTERVNVESDISEDAIAASAGAHDVTATITGQPGWDLAAAAFRSR